MVLAPGNQYLEAIGLKLHFVNKVREQPNLVYRVYCL